MAVVFQTPIVIGLLGTAISSARPEACGLASGIVNTSYQVGSALGLADTTALATAQGADTASLTDGDSAAFLGAAVTEAALAAVLLRTAKAAAVTSEPASA